MQIKKSKILFIFVVDVLLHKNLETHVLHNVFLQLAKALQTVNYTVKQR